MAGRTVSVTGVNLDIPNGSARSRIRRINFMIKSSGW